MENNIINELSNNIIFKKIEEKADREFKTIYNRPPLEAMLFSKKEVGYKSSLSLNSLSESIAISYCLIRISSLSNNIQLFKKAPFIYNNEEETLDIIKNQIKENLKYVTYLFYHIDSMDILNVHRMICSSSEIVISYKNLFNYMILSKTLLNNKSEQYSEFLLYLIAKIDDLKISFREKWENIIIDLIKNFELYKSDCKNAFDLNYTLFKYCYQLICLKKQKYNFYKLIFSNELIFDVKIKNEFLDIKKEFKYKKFIDSIHTLSEKERMEKSNLSYAKDFLKEHKQNIKNLKKYINEYNENKITNEVALLFFKNYYDDLRECINKYFKDLEKIKL